MKQWYVKDLSRLTNVTVQTLHHYDRINLLKPSLRAENGYRIYSEKDLLHLQQIIALKYFGFELSQIKALLSNKTGAVNHLTVQVQILEQKANALRDASNTLKSILAEVKDDKSIQWETIIKLIEVYRMTQKLDHSWVKDIFTPEELKQYAAFESELTSTTPEQKANFEKSWSHLVNELKKNIDNDPTSNLGIQLGKKFMEWVNKVYGKKYAHLRTKKFEKGFGEGKGLDEVGLTPELVAWLEKAMDAYWHERIYGILAKVGKSASSDVLMLWNEVLDDMYGDETARKQEVLQVALKNEKVSKEAKQWLRSLAK